MSLSQKTGVETRKQTPRDYKAMHFGFDEAQEGADLVVVGEDSEVADRGPDIRPAQQTDHDQLCASSYDGDSSDVDDGNGGRLQAADDEIRELKAKLAAARAEHALQQKRRTIQGLRQQLEELHLQKRPGSKEKVNSGGARVGQFDFLLRKCERLTSLQENQSIPDQNNKQETGYDAQPETNENLKPITDQNKQPDSGNNLESVKDQHINPIASQNNHPEINHNLQQETVQNLRLKINHTTQPETDQTLRAIKDNNTQPEMDQNTQPRTHRNTPPEMDQNIQPITNHSSQSKTDQIIQPLTNHSTKPEMDQNIQPITDYITRREPDHDLKFTTDQRKQVETDHKDQPIKDLQSTTGHPLKHAEFYNKKSKLDQDHYLPVDEYDMGDEVSGAKYMGPGDLLCQMCSSVITSPEKQKCETQFCDY